MEDVNTTLKMIFQKVSDFFDIFDLSFFVSGAVAFGAVVYWFDRHNIDLFYYDGWGSVFVVIISCYVCGLICFSFGRYIRVNVLRDDDIDGLLRNVIDAHGLREDALISDYINRSINRPVWRLYIRLWAEMRQSSTMAPSMILLKRYWVMAATYDGLTFSLLILASVILYFQLTTEKDKLEIAGISYIVIVSAVALAFICFNEARRNVRNQVEEIVATYAHWKRRWDLPLNVTANGDTTHAS